MESMDILAFTYWVWTLEFWSVMGKVVVSLLFTNWLQLKKRKAMVNIMMIFFLLRLSWLGWLQLFIQLFCACSNEEMWWKVHHRKVSKLFNTHELKTLRICTVCRKTPSGSKEQEKPFLLLHWVEKKITLNTTYFKYSAKTKWFTIHPVLPLTYLKWQYKPHRKKNPHGRC